MELLQVYEMKYSSPFTTCLHVIDRSAVTTVKGKGASCSSTDLFLA